MSREPLVTVVLPCFNGEAVIADAVRSITSQTYRALEILVLDDGSTDGTAAVVEALQREDSRIRLSRSSTNTGLIRTLNRGIADASGELIARMDDDDISAPTRIAKTVALFNARPELAAAGTNTHYVSALDGGPVQPRPARCFEPDGARFMTLFAPPIVHPTLVAKTDVLRAHPYGTGSASLYAEDYELFARMAESGLALMNLRERLVTVRVRPHGVSLSNEHTQIVNFVACARDHLEKTTGEKPAEPVHRVLVNRMDDRTTPTDLVAGLELLDRLERGALAAASDQASREDIRRVANMQRFDIVSQTILYGDTQLRTRAIAQVAHDFRRLVSSDVRSYMGRKLRVVLARRSS